MPTGALHRKPNKAIRFSAMNILEDGPQTVSKLPLRNELRYLVDLFRRRRCTSNPGEADISVAYQSVTESSTHSINQVDDVALLTAVAITDAFGMPVDELIKR